MGLTLAGVEHELAWYAEIDKHASAVMEHHHPGVPNVGDLTKLGANVEPVDIVTAGFPCQPFSMAGKREGTNDERWLIDDVCRIARDSGARWLILENVPGILTANDGHAMARVCAAMAEAGFVRWEWTTLRASDVGACHRRERWFCIASTADANGPRSQGPSWNDFEPGARRRRSTESDIQAGTTVFDFGKYNSAVRYWETVLGRIAPDPLIYKDGDVADAGSKLRDERLRQSRCDASEHAKRQAHNDNKPRSFADVIQRGRNPQDIRLNPRFVEWMMGLPDGHVTNYVQAHGPKLKMLGNGVVPLQAAAAIHELATALNTQQENTQ